MDFFILISHIHSRNSRKLFQVGGDDGCGTVFLPICPFGVYNDLLPLPGRGGYNLLAYCIIAYSLAIIRNHDNVHFGECTLHGIQQFLLSLFVQAFIFCFKVQPYYLLAVAYYAGFGDGWVFCMKQFVSDTQISEHLLHCVSVVVVAKQADDIRRATQSQQISCNIGRSSQYIVGTGDTDHWYGGFGRNPFHVPYMVSIQHHVSDNEYLLSLYTV